MVQQLPQIGDIFNQALAGIQTTMPSDFGIGFKPTVKIDPETGEEIAGAETTYGFIPVGALESFYPYLTFQPALASDLAKAQFQEESLALRTQLMAQAQLQGDQIRAQAQITSAQIAADATVASANIRAGADIQVAQIQNQGLLERTRMEIAGTLEQQRMGDASAAQRLEAQLKLQAMIANQATTLKLIEMLGSGNLRDQISARLAIRGLGEQPGVASNLGQLGSMLGNLQVSAPSVPQPQASPLMGQLGFGGGGSSAGGGGLTPAPRTGTSGGGYGNIFRVNTGQNVYQVPGLQYGGSFWGGTRVVGESGPELVRSTGYTSVYPLRWVDDRPGTFGQLRQAAYTPPPPPAPAPAPAAEPVLEIVPQTGLTPPAPTVAAPNPLLERFGEEALGGVPATGLPLSDINTIPALLQARTGTVLPAWGGGAPGILAGEPSLGLGSVLGPARVAPVFWRLPKNEQEDLLQIWEFLGTPREFALYQLGSVTPGFRFQEQRPFRFS